MSVKTTKIEKKNKETGRVTVIHYAMVKDRLKEFRSNPDYRELTIHTESTEFAGGVKFRAEILADNGHFLADGEAFTDMTGQKAFEKCQTIAVGRALGFLGIMADGSIATGDEMQDVIEGEAPNKEKLENARQWVLQEIEDSPLDDDSLELIRTDLYRYTLEELRETYQMLRGVREESRKDDSTSQKQISKRVSEKLEDPRA